MLACSSLVQNPRKAPVEIFSTGALLFSDNFLIGHFNEISIQCLPNKIIRRYVLLAARSAYTPIVRLKARTYWILYSLIAP